MKTLIAKINDGQFVSICKDDDPSFASIQLRYTETNIDTCDSKEFDTNTALHDDEWFHIEPTEDQLYDTLTGYEQILNNTTSLNTVSADDYSKIIALFLFESTDGGSCNITFTRIFPARGIVKNKLFLGLDTGSITTSEIKNSIEITGTSDAFWDGSKLLFKKFNNIKPLFSGIADYYIVATPKQTQEFLNNGIFTFKDGVNAENFSSQVKERNLKRIAAILDQSEVDFTKKKQREKYKKYAEKYSQKLNFDDNHCMLLENNASLTQALKVVEENYYTSEVTGIAKEADHARRIQS